MPLSRALQQAPKLLLAAGLPLAMLSWAEMAAFMYDPQLMYNQPTGQSQLLLWLATTTSVDLSAWVPSFVAPFTGLELTYAWVAGAGALVAGLALLLMRNDRRASGHQPALVHAASAA